MSRVFITGDVHVPHDIHKLNSTFFPAGKELTKDDILIICGDAGFIWSEGKEEKYWLDWISNKNWTTVYCDGNHENHARLREFPVVDFKGAKAHKITDSLFHIMRGEITTINDETYFFFGGAFYHDIQYRTENISWWQAELPVQEEVDNALDNLQKHNNKVDYIITHDVPSSINQILGYNIPNMRYYDSGYIHICKFFEHIKDTVEFKNWFAGHYHVNSRIDKFQILYTAIIEIKGYKV